VDIYKLTKTVNDLVDDNFREPTFNLEGTNVSMGEINEELFNKGVCQCNIIIDVFNQNTCKKCGGVSSES